MQTRIGCIRMAAVLAILAGALWAEESVKLTDDLSLGRPVVAENATVWPVFSKTPPPTDQGDFITLAQAQEKKQAEIRERGAGPQTAEPNLPAQPQQVGNPENVQTTMPQQVDQMQQVEQMQQVNQMQQVRGAESAQVNQLVIENKSSQPILVLAGTLVKGGKQDRQIAQDFIIPPGKTVPVDAFCVEHGRWTAQREGQATQGQFEAQQVMALKEVRDSAQFKSDQSAVWQEVATANHTNAKAPATGTLMASIEETDPEALARRERIRTGLKQGLADAPTGPVGLAYAIDGKVREVRAFNDPRILNHHLDTLLTTIAIEADMAQRKALQAKQAVFNGTADSNDVVSVIREAEKNAEERVQTKAGNMNAYRKGAKSSASKNYADADDAKDGKAPVSQTWSAH